MFQDMEGDGIVLTEEQLKKVYGPIGLDIGAETSEEIAISTVAEIRAVIAGRNGGLLRDKTEPIHGRLQRVDNA
jgi:xanthine/CO dehydrogenase XdhC/CoxF family maturation factor